MSRDIVGDQLAVIRIEGMHCHKCERAIQQALASRTGVHEVEVDFNSGQASVLFDHSAISIAELMQTVRDVGYDAAGYTQRAAE